MKPSNARIADAANETAAAADVDLSALQQLIGFRVRMFDIGMHQAFYDRITDRAFTPAIFSTLAAIRRNPGVRHGALADALRVQRPNMTSLLNELERKGYVSRRPSNADKRSIALFLTERGERAVAKMQAAMLAFDRDMTAGLTERERRTLLELLGKALPGAPERIRRLFPPISRASRRRYRYILYINNSRPTVKTFTGGLYARHSLVRHGLAPFRFALHRLKPVCVPAVRCTAACGNFRQQSQDRRFDRSGGALRAELGPRFGRGRQDGGRKSSATRSTACRSRSFPPIIRTSPTSAQRSHGAGSISTASMPSPTWSILRWASRCWKSPRPTTRWCC